MLFAAWYRARLSKVEDPPLLTSVDCEALAEENRAHADDNQQFRKRRLMAAEAWLFLADQLRLSETRSCDSGGATGR
jgi:hypothetical protein